MLTSALRELTSTKNITEAPSDCETSGTIWDTGKQLFESVPDRRVIHYFLLFESYYDLFFAIIYWTGTS